VAYFKLPINLWLIIRLIVPKITIKLNPTRKRARLILGNSKQSQLPAPECRLNTQQRPHSSQQPRMSVAQKRPQKSRRNRPKCRRNVEKATT